MPNRQKRREAKFGKPHPLATPEQSMPLQSPNKLLEAKDRVLLCLAVVMWIVPLPSSLGEVGLVVRMVIVGALLSFSLLHTPWIKQQQRTLVCVMFAALVLVVAAYIWYLWPAPKRHSLSANEKQNFTSKLRASKARDKYVQLACESNDPQSCTYAAQLIPLFADAGWKVDASVLRTDLTTPIAGVSLAQHDYYPQQSTLFTTPTLKWHLVHQETSDIRDAFNTIGIEPSYSLGFQVPEHKIIVQIGTPKNDESEPTNIDEDIRDQKNFKGKDLSGTGPPQPGAK